MLLLAAFRGPADFLPFEPGAQWTLQHVRGLLDDPVVYRRMLPDTLVFVAGTVVLVFCIAFTLAWLVERTDLPGRDVLFPLILFPLLVPIPVLADCVDLPDGAERRLAQPRHSRGRSASKRRGRSTSSPCRG